MSITTSLRPQISSKQPKVHLTQGRDWPARMDWRSPPVALDVLLMAVRLPKLYMSMAEQRA
jgi:hypothetical protein